MIKIKLDGKITIGIKLIQKYPFNGINNRRNALFEMYFTSNFL